MLDLYLVEFFTLLIFDFFQFKILSIDSMIDIRLFLLKLLRLTLEFLQVFFDCVCLKGLFLDHAITTCYTSRYTVNLVFSHFALFDQILLMLQLLCQIRIQHLFINIKSTVILFFNGYN